MKPTEIINWTALSKHLTGGANNIRENKIPIKYQEEVNELMSYIKSWTNREELTSKDKVIKEANELLKRRFDEFVANMHNYVDELGF